MSGSARRGYVVYRGKSQLDGAPIVGLLTIGTDNRKIGKNMAQLWIIRADIAPHDAIVSGDDSSVCGECPLRRNGCYVLAYQAPLAIWRKLNRGGYTDLTDGADLYRLREILRGIKLRLGAYGDPVALPFDLVDWLCAISAGHVGYSHQLFSIDRSLADRWANLLMVNCDTPAQIVECGRRGWRYFATMPANDILRQKSLTIVERSTGRLPVECPATTHDITCEQCMLCAGKSRSARSIFIKAHGRSATSFNQFHSSSV